MSELNGFIGCDLADEPSLRNGHIDSRGEIC